MKVCVFNPVIEKGNCILRSLTKILEKDYFEVLSKDKRILSIYSEEEIYSMLDPKSYTGESKNIALEISKKAKEKVKEMRLND